jgi:hypothetical protein
MRSAGSRISFDYIIVGAGSAGCVLASRLTEDQDTRVLVLESGPSDRSWRIDMPSAVGSLLCSKRFNFSYVSEPEPYLDGRRLLHPRGRVLGGSSSINGMVYVRGHALDYDGWAGMGLSDSRTSSARRVIRSVPVPTTAQTVRLRCMHRISRAHRSQPHSYMPVKRPATGSRTT